MSQSTEDAAVSLDPVEVSGDEVTLEREPEFRDEGVVLTYRLRPETEDSYAVTIADAVPEPLPAESAGFHPENEPADWAFDDRALYFEAVVPREGERIVVFGVALADTDESEVELAEPTVEAVEEAADRDDLDAAIPNVDAPDRADAIAQVIEDGEGLELEAGDGDEPPLEDDPDDGPASSDEIEAALDSISEEDQSADATDLDDDLESAAVRVEEDASAAAADGPVATTAAPAADGLVDALVAELEAGDVTDEQRETLAEALGYASEDSLDVRLRHVQSRMDEFAAYADALEEVIDEHGTADAFMDEIDERVETVEEQVDGVEERFEEMAERLDDVAKTAATDEETEALRDDVADLEADIAEVAGMRETLLQALSDE
jgi:polyhydroxyalkanoate synthesis regulator phasin